MFFLLVPPPAHQVTELDYLTQIVFRMYENTDPALMDTDPRRFRVEVSFRCVHLRCLGPLSPSPSPSPHRRRFWTGF